jgi:hypothetical protein
MAVVSSRRADCHESGKGLGCVTRRVRSPALPIVVRDYVRGGRESLPAARNVVSFERDRDA